jgi:site-specific recombinase XerD
MGTTELTPTNRADLAPTGILEAFAAFLRLNVAQGDASPETIRAYHRHAGQYVAWCAAQGIAPAEASEHDLEAYRRALVETGQTRATIAGKLAAVRRLYAAATWRGLRHDNPAEGLRAPRERTARAERIRYLPLDGLRRLLAAPDMTKARGKRDAAALALMGLHGLRVAEVCALRLEDLDLDTGTARVLGKGRKERRVFLIAHTTAAIRVWLGVRDRIARPGVAAVFLALDHRTHGMAMTTRAIRRVVDGYLAQSGMKAEGVSCHSLRHSAATWALAGGAKLEAIGDMLGHSSRDTTALYARIVDRMASNPARYAAEMLGLSVR